MGAHNQNSLQSKADQTVRISKSVFVSNFPEGCTAKDLWKVCNDYGTVVDVFIPTKKSKVGKRFAFVRFIKVINLDRLIENLNTIWIGRFHLFANPARFERPKKPNLSSHNNVAAAPSYPRGVDQAKVTINGLILFLRGVTRSVETMIMVAVDITDDSSLPFSSQDLQPDKVRLTKFEQGYAGGTRAVPHSKIDSTFHVSRECTKVLDKHLPSGGHEMALAREVVQYWRL
ncbi:RNA-directed DNA polymerase, eukaryota, nucleotide-binding alpha-beta plait domain protein [Tanacetum coccineum]